MIVPSGENRRPARRSRLATRSWRPSRRRVSLAATPWQTVLARPPKVRVQSGFLPPVERPGVVSIRLDGLRIRTTSLAFGDDAEGGSDPLAALCGPADGSSAPSARRPVPGLRPAPAEGGGTRIKPPGDVIKLEDRLFYLLQPPLESLLSDAALEFPFPPFPYQFEGVAFLYPRYSAILADEMGLGKTMQAITAIRLLFWRREARRVLLIAPKPLVTNWQREFAMWAPELPLTVVEGHPLRRRWLWQLPEAVVTVANYELVLRDADVLCQVETPFDLVVLDESQRIKNRASTTNQVICQIPRTRSWALTGTPVENSTDDLVGIFEFLAPGYLHADMKPRRMGHAVSDYVLRRTKDKVLKDLPPKLQRDADLDLTPPQREAYDRAEEKGRVKFSQMGSDLAIQHVLELILRLKQICNFDPATGASAKLERLQADLDECAASGRKAIVFSQWVETLLQLRDRLAPFRPLEYHGRVPRRRRDAVLEKFRDDPHCHVLLMSYGAGGVGLNLQFAGYVFLFDRWWNPAVEDQAINRAHRIGVTSPVVVTRFLTRGTIEERIDEILAEKRMLFETIFSETRPAGNLGLSQQELFGLFNLQRPAACAAARHAA
jgi:SNF2 family DNA or RNA helicase